MDKNIGFNQTKPGHRQSKKKERRGEISPSPCSHSLIYFDISCLSLLVSLFPSTVLPIPWPEMKGEKQTAVMFGFRIPHKNLNNQGF